MTCINQNHDHTTTVDPDGNEVAQPIAMNCGHCKLPAHYDYTIEGYVHDDPNAPECFLIGPFQGEPCQIKATLTEGSKVRFHPFLFAVLRKQVAFNASGSEQIARSQADGMTVVAVLPNGKVNVEVTGGSVRTFRPRDLVAA